MPYSKIPLAKLLRISFSPEKKQNSLINRDVYADQRRAAGYSSAGGDFYGPFWKDVKDHVAGTADLTDSVNARIESNKRRDKLYRLLSSGFLTWWDDKRRWWNTTIKLVPGGTKGQYDGPGCVVTVHNAVLVDLGDGTNRIIYPYPSEFPPLTPESARVALFVMAKALPDYDEANLRILDIVRSRSYGIADVGSFENEGQNVDARINHLNQRRSTIETEKNP